MGPNAMPVSEPSSGPTARAKRAAWRTLICTALALVAAAVIAAPVTSSLQPFSSEDPGSASVAARRAIERVTGVDPYFNIVALVPASAGVHSAAVRAKVAKVEHALAVDPAVAAVHSYYVNPEPGLVSLDGHSTLVVGALRSSSISSQLAGARRVEQRLSPLAGVKLGGLAAFYAQGNDTAREDLIRAELFAFPLLLLISLWIFRGLIAALLPLLIGAVTIVGTLAILRLTSELTNVSVYALNIATALGLGLSVDYSLLIISRYREEMGRVGPSAAALSRTLATAGRTVVISSLTVAGVMSCLLVFPQPFLRSIGLGGILVAAIAGSSALIILPAILSLLRWRVNSLSPARWRRAAHEGAQPMSSGAWHHIARVVTRRPLWVALASAALLLGLSVPLLNLRITQVDANVVPRGSGARVVHEAVESHFSRVDNSPVFLAVDAPADAASGARLASYAARLSRLPNVAVVESPRAIGARLWQINVLPNSAPLSAASQHLVSEVRALPSSYPILVGGESASAVDLKDSIADHIPLALLLLTAVTAIAVFALTASLVMPIVALLMSALTITAAFGGLVLVFQNGALEGLLDYTSSHALEAATLVLIFALSFGLATDYGIFLLSRIKEIRDNGAPNAEAVSSGLERTGRIVTAAALLLCVALGSLMTARHALVKEAGFGAALAVAIDATVVRAMLLPASLRLLGAASWWSPGALSRLARAGARRSRSEPMIRTALKLTPSQGISAEPDAALAVTRYCDHDDRAIQVVLSELSRDGRSAGAERAGGDVAVAVAAFEFVRDEVAYTLGSWGVSASSTLGQRSGMCTNKANLLVALLRAADIPAAYGVMRVNAREYFGVIGPAFLTRYISPESTHVYAAAFLDGRWVKCDPSTDREMASRTAHFCRQTQLIEWDGTCDSLDFLDPVHVYADLGLYADIDELFEKPARGATPERLALWNDYLEFIRSQPAFPSSDALIRAYRATGNTERLLGVTRQRANTAAATPQTGKVRHGG
jgi:uncharacterized membrane protein YdfJ with MMPL/SSD domain